MGKTKIANDLGVLLRMNHPAAVRAVKRAFVKSKGTVRGAAIELGVAESTLHVWMKIPALRMIRRRSREENGQNLTK